MEDTIISLLQRIEEKVDKVSANHNDMSRDLAVAQAAVGSLKTHAEKMEERMRVVENTRAQALGIAAVVGAAAGYFGHAIH